MFDIIDISILALCGVVFVASVWSLGRLAMEAQYPAQIRRRLLLLNRSAPAPLEPHRSRGSILDGFGRLILNRNAFLAPFEELTRSAGYFSPYAPYRFAANIVLLGTAGLVTSTATGWGLGLPSWRIALMGVFGLLFGLSLPPVIVLFRKRKRLRTLRHELPFCVDILIVMLRSGSSIEQCFRQILALGPMSFPTTYRTIELLVADLDSGKNYTDTFERWAKLLSVPLAHTLANVFIQALLHGTEISTSLEQLADLLVEERLQDARMAAGKRLPQLTVIMLVFLLPPMLVIIAMPALSQLMAGMGHLK